MEHYMIVNKLSLNILGIIDDNQSREVNIFIVLYLYVSSWSAYVVSCFVKLWIRLWCEKALAMQATAMPSGANEYRWWHTIGIVRVLRTRS